MALTDAVVRQAKITGKDYPLNDSDGLLLFVTARRREVQFSDREHGLASARERRNLVEHIRKRGPEIAP